MNEILLNKNIALFSNHTSYLPTEGKYLAELLSEKKKLRQLFIPEHGFFAEWQDQHKLNQPQYDFINEDIDIVSLYGNTEESLKPNRKHFEDIDALLIDIRDVGARYFTFITHIYYLLQAVQNSDRNIKIIVVDYPNAAGNQVEGTMLPEKYSSFLGVTGLPHRYGLSIGELSLYFKAKLNADFDLHIEKPENDFWIQPSPNMPTRETVQVYSGQCLFEGTTLSEGRGTTKPFEIFGGPFLSYDNVLKIRDEVLAEYPYTKDSFILRPLQFVPAFHKHGGEICNGFQVHLKGPGYHSLMLSMILLRKIQDHSVENIFLSDSYEYGSDKPAIEILLGDDVLLNFVHGKGEVSEIQQYLREQEQIWFQICRGLSFGATQTVL